jgi:CRP/FNR family transcriptional regulator, cyclic AMP receptor protein
MAVAPRLDLPDLVPEDERPCGPIQRDQLRKVPLFDALSDDAAEKLCSLLVLREFKAPTRLFDAGDQGDAMYLIDHGRVRITVTDADGQEVTLSELHDGDFFGEMALIDGHERSAGATVLEDSRLVMLRREDFLSFLAHEHDVMLAMLAAMARRLRRTDNMLRHRVSRNANAEEAAHNTPADRAADLIAQFGGSWGFIGVFLVLLCIWAGINVWLLRAKAFDPYPFVFLNLVLAVVTSLQAPIIMMSQNRQTQKDRLRSDLDYDVNLKNEMLLTEIRSLLHEQRRRENKARTARS